MFHFFSFYTRFLIFFRGKVTADINQQNKKKVKENELIQEGIKDLKSEDFADEINDNMDNIKCLSLVYLEKIMRLCDKNNFKLNPGNTIKYAYQFSSDPQVHELAYNTTLLIKKLGLYKGFTIEYIDFYSTKKVNLVSGKNKDQDNAINTEA
jgi:hypothetical protein